MSNAPKDNPTHPGKTIAECVREDDMSAAAVARALGMNRRHLYRLMNCEIGISAKTALALEAIGWSNAEFWMRCQTAHDLARERRRRDAA